MFDTHVHTSYSTDSKMNIIEALKTSNKLGLGVIITEHMDLMYPKKGKFVFDIGKYFREYASYRNDNVLLGIEMGMRNDCISENEKIAKSYPFDFIIGSLHMVNSKDIFYDELYAGRRIEEVYEEYLTSMLECLKTHNFIDSLGHIDYIARYARYEDTEIYYNQYCDLIDAILKFIIQNGKAIEINTRRFNDKNAVNNMLTIYKRYKELGGELVTLGSDSHSTDALGKNLNIAKDIAEICGLKIVYFKNRKPYLDRNIILTNNKY